MGNTIEQDKQWRPTRDQLIDSMGRPLTQSLFLEIGYSDAAIYTLKDVDHEYEGKIYPSMKRLYLEVADPTEYKFATTYLANWPQWMKISKNGAIKNHVEAWRMELEIKLRSEGVLAVRRHSQSNQPTAWSASKWLADKGWENRSAGRPSNAEVERELKVQAAIEDEFTKDHARLVAIK